MANSANINSVHTIAALTAFSLAYKNPETIWRMVAPIVKVDQRSDLYYTFGGENEYRVTDDRIGTMDRANNVELFHDSATFNVQSAALEFKCPVTVLEEADDQIKPKTRGMAQVRKQLDANHELRIVQKVFTAANVPAANKITLAGVNQWSDQSSDPLGVIQDRMDAMLIRPNKLVLGRDSWRILRRHVKLTAALYPGGGNATAGASNAKLADLADYLELDEIIVGSRRIDVANPGQAQNIQRAWGKHALLMYQAKAPAKEEMSFAYTFSESLSAPVEEIETLKGEKGVYVVRDAWNHDAKIVAWDGGFLFDQCVA